MISKEILLSAIHLQKTPRVPVIKLSGGVWIYLSHGLSLQDILELPPEKGADLILRANEELGLDMIWTGAGCNNVLLRAIGAKITFNKIGAAATVAEPLISNADDLDRLKINRLEKRSWNRKPVENDKDPVRAGRQRSADRGQPMGAFFAFRPDDGTGKVSYLYNA